MLLPVAVVIEAVPSGSRAEKLSFTGTAIAGTERSSVSSGIFMSGSALKLKKLSLPGIVRDPEAGGREVAGTPVVENAAAKVRGGRRCGNLQCHGQSILRRGIRATQCELLTRGIRKR